MEPPPRSPWHGPPVFDEVSVRAGLPAPAPLPATFIRLPWFRQTWGIVAIALSAALIASLGTAAIFLSQRPGTETATLAGPASTATSVRILTLPTKTPGIHLISGPYIGGTEDAFTTHYGDPIVSFGIAAYETTIGGAAVTIRLPDLLPGTDGQQRDDILALSDPDGSAWDASTSTAVIQQFLPPDAHHIRDDQTPDVGTLHVFQSSDLAATFPASAFTNSSGEGLEPPGTFSYTCDRPGLNGCAISIGE